MIRLVVAIEVSACPDEEMLVELVTEGEEELMEVVVVTTLDDFVDVCGVVCIVAVDGEAVDGESVDGEAVDGESVDGKAVDEEAVDGEAVDGEDVDAVDGEAVDKVIGTAVKSCVVVLLASNESVDNSDTLPLETGQKDHSNSLL
ncbi:hypothetical protein Btru_057472 [Bulinus truncatus]|nr:hypothetical protein Btru_057472 [Bulinus truncatus]